MKDSIKSLHNRFLIDQQSIKHLSPRTIDGLRVSFDLLLKLMPNLTLEELTEKTLADFFHLLDTRSRIVGRGEVIKGVKKSTTASHWSRLNRFFKWLEKRGYILKDHNPLRNIEFPKVYYDDRRYLSGSDVRKIINTVYSMPTANNFIKKRNIALFMTLLFTGIRRGEILGLEDRHVILDKNIIKIPKEISKSRIDRTVLINRELRQVLEDYIGEKRGSFNYFFLSNNTKTRLSQDGFKHLIQKVKDLSGVNFHAHQFRHTYAVNFLRQKGDSAQLKQLLGHMDLRMTSQYLRCLPNESMRETNNLIRLENLAE